MDVLILLRLKIISYMVRVHLCVRVLAAIKNMNVFMVNYLDLLLSLFVLYYKETCIFSENLDWEDTICFFFTSALVPCIPMMSQSGSILLFTWESGVGDTQVSVMSSLGKKYGSSSKHHSCHLQIIYFS